MIFGSFLKKANEKANNFRALFTALLDRIEGNGVHTVIVEDATRFARELITQELGIVALVARGVAVLTASGDELTNTDDPFKVAMRQIAGAFAQLEKARLVAKLRAARERKRAEGHKVEGRKSLAESRPEAVAMAKNLSKQLPHRSLREIAAELAAAGFTTPRGLPYSASAVASNRLRVVGWTTPSDLRQVLDTILAEELKLEKDTEQNALSVSLGGKPSGDYVYFSPGPQIAQCDDWQILTPLRNQSSGSIDLNRHIKTRFRKDILAFARSSNEGPPYYLRYRMIVPRGPEQITYGDKVICIKNHERDAWLYADGKEQEGYIANGEIGVVVGEAYKGRQRPDWTKVQFSSQKDVTYGFGGWDFKEEGTPILELAYAVTVHKAQGSEFRKVFLVLPAQSRLLSREMLYTALTRQIDRVVLLHQGGLEHLRAYRSPFFSEVARRITNLFDAPKMVEAAPPPGIPAGTVGRTFLEEKLIHRSLRGDLVASKSELTIADALYEAEKTFGIRYFFERVLIGGNGRRRWPDFSIEDRNGATWYWEHCGMLDQPDYEKRWKAKLAFYEENKIKRWSPQTPQGRLIVTADGPRQGLDSQAIRALINTLWGPTKGLHA